MYECNLKPYCSVAIGRKAEFCGMSSKEGAVQPFNSSSVVLGWHGRTTVLMAVSGGGEAPSPQPLSSVCVAKCLTSVRLAQ